MITIKSDREISLMREAGRMVALTREEVKKHIKPGMDTKTLDRIAEDYILSLGGIPSFKDYNGFPGSVCLSVNEVVVHGIPSKKVILKEGDLVSLDIGVLYKGYHGDSAWTFPVGSISEENQQLLDVTLQSLYEGLKQIKPGNRVSDISHAIETYVKPFGYGIVEEFTGHGIGSKLHEDPYVPNFGKPGTGPVLKKGMTLCVEPMVNIGTKRVVVLKDNWTTVTADRKNSAHFEHMIVVTEDGCEILTEL
ncbi:MAG: type I methionyl aminopeptidase [Paracholeplasma sp.]|jgi:methionyl aminopeptidase|uniref:Methionine aminopeptidase n=1 Tax=Acholeplasma brassicae TaxID=61635 RepID=U4KMC6_9MOLU|nr:MULTISPECIES: type I methionyl aminopeptidase [Paracholeplasma]MDY3196068.1 type I methionyl aminopeptidase [Paracholeplasma sp.]CCV65277.1 Methionine aminopeptidase [Paracholeplasma brassicae]